MAPTAHGSAEVFLALLAGSPPGSFERRFSDIAARLELGQVFDGPALKGLLDAAYLARLCKISFNGLGGCNGVIRPERESTRRALEQDFMAAKEQCYACAGWKGLTQAQKEEVSRVFFSVSVADKNLAAEPKAAN